MKRPSTVDLIVGVKTDRGPVRKDNEDYVGYFVPDEPSQRAAKGALFLVADGMGGHQAGEVASREAVQWVIQEYYADTTPSVGEALRRSFESANRRLHDMGQADPARAGMATTLVAAVVRGTPPRVTVANVGDSRAYLLSKKRFQRLTVDHSWVQEQLALDLLTADEADKHPMRNLVTRSLGSRPSVEVDLFEANMRPGDALLLCTDGLSGEVPEAEMARLARTYPPSEAAAQLVAQANQGLRGDNVSVLIAQGRPAARSAPWWQGLLRRQPIEVEWRIALLIGLLLLAVLCFVFLAAALLPGLMEQGPAEGPASYPRPAPYRPPGAKRAIELASAQLFLVGQVLHLTQDDQGYTLRLEMASQSFSARCDPLFSPPAALAKGSWVKVLCQRGERGSLLALWIEWLPPGSDLRSASWQTVYRDSESWGQPVWLYAVADQHPFSPLTEEQRRSWGLKDGEPILLHGRWAGPQPLGHASLSFVVERAYRLEKGVYVPAQTAPPLVTPTVTLIPVTPTGTQ